MMTPSAPPDSPTAILATAVVPWTERYEFDEAMFCRQVHTIANNLTRHIYVSGTAGEGYAVTEKQFDPLRPPIPSRNSNPWRRSLKP